MNLGNVTVTEIDQDTLAQALLPTAKTHLRVEFTRDDEYIVQALQRAINLCERFTGRSVFERTVDWWPVPYPSMQQVPYQPVSVFAATDAEGTDVAASYQLLDRGGAVYMATTDPTLVFGSGVKFTLTTGYSDETLLDLGLLDIILRITAGLYETREHQTTVTMEMVSFWMQDLIVGGGWIPRV